jgi:hypothetical protein
VVEVVLAVWIEFTQPPDRLSRGEAARRAEHDGLQAKARKALAAADAVPRLPEPSQGRRIDIERQDFAADDGLAMVVGFNDVGVLRQQAMGGGLVGPDQQAAHGLTRDFEGALLQRPGAHGLADRRAESGRQAGGQGAAHARQANPAR